VLNTTSRYPQIATSKVCATASPLDALAVIHRGSRRIDTSGITCRD
jgi:hypothetical protein